MGYRIIYLPERKKKRVWPWAALLLGVGLLCVSLFPQGRQAIETALLPGEPERTRQALANLAQALRGGGEIPDAFVRFCREVAAGLG